MEMEGTPRVLGFPSKNKADAFAFRTPFVNPGFEARWWSARTPTSQSRLRRPGTRPVRPKQPEESFL